MKRQHNKSKIIISIVIIIIAVAAAVCGFIFIKNNAYQSGLENGIDQTNQKVQGKLETLASAMDQKTNIANDLQSLMNDVPQEIDEAGATKYLENLSALITKTDNQATKTILEEYQKNWEAFKQKIQSKDVSTADFDTLKSSAAETAKKIELILNQDIEKAIDELPLE